MSAKTEHEPFLPRPDVRPAGFNCNLCGGPIEVTLGQIYLCNCNRAVLVFDDVQLDASAWRHAVILARHARCTIALHDFSNFPSGLN
jgi:hypothetical protein